MKCEKVTLKLSNLGHISSCNIVIYSDASLVNLRDGGSQGGFLVFLEGENKKFSLVYWQLSKVKRVVKSTLAAECFAELEGAEMAFVIRSVLCDILQLSFIKFCQSYLSLTIGLCLTLYILRNQSQTKD